MKKSMGILGGMGPLATADLFRKIISLTKADSDAEHIHIYIDNDPAIPDRTAAILSGGPDPLPRMTAALRNLERCGADCILLPCNTAHHYLPALQAETSLPILDMLAETARVCAHRYPGEKAAVLATKGTLATGLYDRALATAGVEVMAPDEAEQEILMHLIYDVVKAGLPLAPQEGPWRGLLNRLRSRGAAYFVLGCTELPILAQTLPVPVPFVDATECLARAAIRFCGYQEL